MNRPLVSSDRMALETAAPSELPVAIIGAGPVGLAAAVHLLGYGIEPVVLEAGTVVGAAVRDWGHVPMFSPWGYSTDRTAVALLRRHGWTHPDEAGYPTGRDLAERYLDPLAATPEVAGRLRLGTRVTGIARAGLGKVRTAGREDRPFEVRYVDDEGREGRLFVRAVIDASGTWSSPNPAGASGLPAVGERAAASRIRYGMPDVLGRERDRYAGRRILVLGSGHSATGTLLDLADLAREAPGTSIVWAFRNTDRAKLFGGGEADQLPRRGALGLRLRALAEAGTYEIVAPFAVDAIEAAGNGLRVLGDQDGAVRGIEADEMVVATGLRPDLSILAELRLDLDPALDCPRALAPLIDPNEHSCGTVRPHGAAELAQPEPGLFIIGMKAYGRAPTFLLATGYEQARSVAAHLAGDHEAARRVELVLPETGVCNGPGRKTEAATCCGPAAPAESATASACCG
ncbi:NAD(P)-binding domain-containing protein [Inquilinus limosus]|uniref:NAD(P)-binding domain-containing protein n=1 Tax=Inquilinus limosus TaxID=171674 RepID=UPI00042066ED|nr:NAD(P)-binding domain-containing protein [Inquilinus limosus]